MQHRQGSTRHVDGGRDGGVEQEVLVWRQAGVRDGPAQVAAVHVLAQPPAAVRLVQPDAPVVLERPCRQTTGAARLSTTGTTRRRGAHATTRHRCVTGLLIAEVATRITAHVGTEQSALGTGPPVESN